MAKRQISSSALSVLRQALLGTFFGGGALVMLSGCGLSGYGAVKPVITRPVYHRVGAGDTLEVIASRYSTDSRSIMMLNGIRSPKSLAPGTRLLVTYRAEDGKAQDLAQSKVSQTVRTFRYDQKLNPPLAWPVITGYIASQFGPRWGTFHDGLDFAAPSGTPVYAAHNGLVKYSGSGLRGYGKLLVIRGFDGLITVYGHNRRLLVEEGERVRRGQKIAEVGETGHATGPHLHFEVRSKVKGKGVIAVDPLPILEGGKNKLRYRVNQSLNFLFARRSG